MARRLPTNLARLVIHVVYLYGPDLMFLYNKRHTMIIRIRCCVKFSYAVIRYYQRDVHIDYPPLGCHELCNEANAEWILEGG